MSGDHPANHTEKHLAHLSTARQKAAQVTRAATRERRLAKREEIRAVKCADTDAKFARVLELVGDGWSIKRAAREAGLSSDVRVVERRAKDPSFDELLKTAQAEGAPMWYRDRNREIAAGNSPQAVVAVGNGLRMTGALKDAPPLPTQVSVLFQVLQMAAQAEAPALPTGGAPANMPAVVIIAKAKDAP